TRNPFCALQTFMNCTPAVFPNARATSPDRSAALRLRSEAYDAYSSEWLTAAADSLATIITCSLKRRSKRVRTSAACDCADGVGLGLGSGEFWIVHAVSAASTMSACFKPPQFWAISMVESC